MADERYEQHRERQARSQREQSTSGRDIGPLPKVAKPARRAKCEKNFRLFCETYFPRAFRLKWSADHLTVLDKVKTTVLDGGQFALAMPRGNGKTTICERACLWAIAYGHHRYTILVCADEKKAKKSLAKIVTEVETNELLAQDFPELCHPVRKLGRIANRAKGQMLDGRPTRIEWEKTKVVFATIDDKPSSGAIIEVGGLTGAIRGASHVLEDGTITRPTLALVDDPQTRESASSPLQCQTRIDTVTTDIQFMCGPDEAISVLMPCTVIRPDDMADRMLDRKQFPEWHGERTRLLLEFPSNLELWEKYAEIRQEELENDGDGRRATAFYRKNRKAMGAGAKVAWPQRKKKGELSALQNAMNIYLFNPRGFWSECQNQPEVENDDGLDDLLTPDDIAHKCHAQRRGLAPLKAERLTAFIDCHQKLLYWAVCAWQDDFTGYVVDYGTFPEQKRSYFAMREARPTLQQKFKGAGVEGALRKGLDALTTQLNRNWAREDGTTLQIERCLIDKGWKPDVVNQFCRESEWNAVLPAAGVGITATKNPMSDWQKKSGERVGPHWRLRSDPVQRVRYVLHDANHWKSFLHARLAVSLGDPGSLSLFHAKPVTHRLLADHFRAEERIRVEANGRTVDQWEPPAGKPDNHWLDCVVGCHVAASLLGVGLPNATGRRQPPPDKPKESMAERRARKRREQGR